MLNKILLPVISLSLFISSAVAQEESAILNTRVEVTYDVKEISSVNTKYADFAPLIFGNRFIFVSDRDFDYLNWGENRWNKNKFLNVFSSQITSVSGDSFKLSNPVIHMTELRHVNHTGPISISTSGDEIVFTQVKKEKKKINKPQLYQIKKENGKWTDKKILSFCQEEYSFGHPSISADGKYLFFSSDMPGGRGGKDIWYCEKNGDSWSAPKNAGKINSSSDELFPYHANNSLYYSSNGTGTSGNLDIFKSSFINNEFSDAVNLGPTINSTGDDFGFTLTKDFKSGFFSSSREGGKGADDIYFFKVIEQVTVESRDIAGKFTYRSLSGGNTNGLEVLLVDDSGNVVMRTFTDENGEFVFKSLPLNEQYTIKVISDNPDMNLEIINRDGEAVAVLVSDPSGSFIYKKLDPSLTGTLGLMEIEDSGLEKSGSLSGQFVYEKLPGVHPDGLTVYLVDDEGNIVMKTKTDDRGNFSFKKLPLDKNLTIKTEGTGDDVILMIYNKNENVTAELRRNEKGEYIFRKLTPEIVGNISLLETNDDPSLVAPKSSALTGQFRYRELKGDTGKLKFIITDNSGNILARGETDEKGNFRIKNLPLMDGFLFKIESDDPNLERKFILDLQNRQGETIAMLESDGNGKFIYRLLEDIDGPTTFLNEDDQAFLSGIPNIHYEKNKSELSPEAKKTLDQLARIMKKDKTLKLEINGYADARYTDEFNMNLSRQRMLSAKTYLIGKGVAAARIKGSFHGESNLLNSCADDKDCTEEQHRENRRCEFRIIR